MTDKELAARVDAWALEHRAELTRDLIRAISQESVSRPGEGGYAMGLGCKQCADLMLELGQNYGFDSENDDYYCVSVLHRGKTDKELGILGHMDVVPAGNGWHYEPFRAVEREGYVIGRGSSDNKGPTIMSLYVLRCIRELGIPLRHTLRLIVGFNEESGMKDVEHYLQGHQPPDYTLICDGGWAMCIGEKGILTADLVQPLGPGSILAMEGGVASNSVPDTAWARLADVPQATLERLRAECPEAEVENAARGVIVRARGRAAHALAPQEGENAIYKLLRLLCEYKLTDEAARKKLEVLRAALCDDYGTGLHIACEDELSGKTTCVGGMLRLQGGMLRQSINVRYAIRQDQEKMLAALRARCKSLGVGLENLAYSPPRYTPPELPVPKLLLETCREFLGRRYEPYVMGGGTHARKFPNALPYGPGIMNFVNPFGSPHGIDEAVCLKHLTDAIKVYVVALLRLDRYFSG